MSAPAPAAPFEIEVDDRLSELERTVEQLERRARELERKSERLDSQLAEARNAAPAAGAGRGWLVWVVFLLVLAIAWHLFGPR